MKFLVRARENYNAFASQPPVEDLLDPPTPPVENKMYGDVNQDKEYNAKDALEILKFAVKKIDFTDEQKELANVDGNDSIDAVDALWVLKKAVNKVEKFPVEQ